MKLTVNIYFYWYFGHYVENSKSLLRQASPDVDLYRILNSLRDECFGLSEPDMPEKKIHQKKLHCSMSVLDFRLPKQVCFVDDFVTETVSFLCCKIWHHDLVNILLWYHVTLLHLFYVSVCPSRNDKRVFFPNIPKIILFSMFMVVCAKPRSASSSTIYTSE